MIETLLVVEAAELGLYGARDGEYAGAGEEGWLTGAVVG